MSETSDTEVIERQLAWYRERRAGCTFAAYAARFPENLGWRHRILRRDEISPASLDQTVRWGVDDPEVELLSILLPTVEGDEDLMTLVRTLRLTKEIWLERDVPFDSHRCLGYRARVGLLKSWISGFGPYNFLPKTRQAPCTELSIRTKPRPNYPYVLKPAPEDVVHLADLNLKGIRGAAFKSMWAASLRHTAKILGSAPDERSAAKTTFAIPLSWFPGGLL